MIDAVWLLSNRALLDYTKTAATWLRTRSRHEGTTDLTDQTMNIDTVEHEPNSVARRIAYIVAGTVVAVLVGPLFAFGAYTVLTSLMSL
jgi:hypothetical protein